MCECVCVSSFVCVRLCVIDTNDFSEVTKLPPTLKPPHTSDRTHALAAALITAPAQTTHHHLTRTRTTAMPPPTLPSCWLLLADAAAAAQPEHARSRACSYRGHARTRAKYTRIRMHRIHAHTLSRAHTIGSVYFLYILLGFSSCRVYVVLFFWFLVLSSPLTFALHTR